MKLEGISALARVLGLQLADVTRLALSSWRDGSQYSMRFLAPVGAEAMAVVADALFALSTF